jgi:hypothetical protein
VRDGKGKEEGKRGSTRGGKEGVQGRDRQGGDGTGRKEWGRMDVRRG